MTQPTNRWWSLPSFEDREKTRIAKTVYLVGATALVAAVCASIANGLLRGELMGVVGLSGFVTCLVCMVAVKRGYVRFGANLLVLFGLVGVLGFLYLPQYVYGFGAWAQVQLMVNLILAVTVFSPRAGLFWIVMNLSLMLALELVPIWGHSLSEIAPQVILSVPVMLVGAVIVYLAADQMRRAMRSAEAGELALQRGYRELEEQIRLREQAEQSYRALVEQAPLGVAVVNGDGVCVQANAALAEIFGLSSPQAMVGRNMRASGADMSMSQSVLDSAVASLERGEESIVETSFQTSWGKNIDLRIHSAPILDANKEATEIIAIVEDISEKRSLEAQLIQSQKMEAIGRLAGGIAHDFNNYLTIVLGNTEFLATELDRDSDLRSSVEEIGQAASQSAALVRQLLAFSRKSVVAPQVIDVNSVIESLHSMVARIAGESIELHEDLTPNPASVHIDPVQLEQILFNLVANARDAMPNGGTLAIETESVHLQGVDPLLRPEVSPGAYVRICVRDSGSGISEEIREHIFEPFFTTKQEQQGTGIGLSTVYGIVTSNGGAVSLRSELGEGTRFYVYLPWVPAAEEETEVAPAKLAPSRGHERVLLVEDERSLRMLARTQLERAGYAVIEASNGQEALDRVRGEEGSIDIVLTDVRMPGMGGFEFAEAFRELHPVVPVIFMSGYVDTSPGEDPSLMEDLSFLPKPFTGSDLLEKLRQVLDAGQS